MRCPFRGCERIATHNAEFPHPELGTADVDCCEEHANTGTNVTDVRDVFLARCTIEHEPLADVLAAYFRSREPKVIEQAVQHLIQKAGFTYETWIDHLLKNWGAIHPKEGT